MLKLAACLVTPKMELLLLTVLQAVLFYYTCNGSPTWQPWKADSWAPDYVLSATAENITINCLSRYSVVFNGTSPGPPLTLKENHTTWVRVYNNIKDQNLTVVSCEYHYEQIDKD